MLRGYHIKKTFEKYLPDLHEQVTPNFTVDISKPSIVYFIRPNTGGDVGKSTLELRVIWSDFDEAEEIVGKIKEVFDTKENKVGVVLSDLSFRGSLSGGGHPFRDDLQMWEYTLFFTLKTKERS